jgi:hypothetical protein
MTLVLLAGIIIVAYTLGLMLHGSRTPEDISTPELDRVSASEEL